MLGCGMYSRPKLADKAKYKSLLKIEYTTTKSAAVSDKFLLLACAAFSAAFACTNILTID